MGRRLRIEADGGSRGNPGPAGYGAVVRDAESGEILAEAAAGIGVATNNVAEYRGLLAGLALALELDDVADVEVCMDSKLVVEQMAGRWQVKHPDMVALRREAAALVARLPRVRFRHVRREFNGHADRLANEAMDAAARGREWVRRTPVREAAEPVEAPATSPAPARRGTLWLRAEGEPTTTLLARHGQTALSVDRRFSGAGDPELTDFGRAQARALAGRAARLARSIPVVAVWSSPLRRAKATAEAVAGELGVPLRVDERLRETDFGAWEGATFAEVQQRWPDELAAWLADPAVAPPGGESFTDVARRVRQARDALIAAHPADSVVVVSHVTPVKSLLRAALEAPVSTLYRLHIDLASLSQVDWYADGQAVVRHVNDTGHLADLDG